MHERSRRGRHAALARRWRKTGRDAALARRSEPLWAYQKYGKLGEPLGASVNCVLVAVRLSHELAQGQGVLRMLRTAGDWRAARRRAGALQRRCSSTGWLPGTVRTMAPHAHPAVLDGHDATCRVSGRDGRRRKRSRKHKSGGPVSTPSPSSSSWSSTSSPFRSRGEAQSVNQSRVGPEERRGHDAPGDSKVVRIFESASYSF